MTAALPTPPELTVDQVAALEADTRTNLAGAVANLTRLREGGAHTLAGFGTWHGYVLDRFGDLLRDLRLTVAERRELVHGLRKDGESLAAIAGKLGASKSIVHRDVQATDVGDYPDNVVSINSARRKARTGPRPVPVVETGLTRVDDVVARVTAAGAAGLTCLELEAATGWGHGTASGALSRAKRQARVIATAGQRDGYGVHTTPPPAD